MSNYLFLNHQSPKNRKKANVEVLQPRLIVRPTSTNTNPQSFGHPNFPIFHNAQSQIFNANLDGKRRDVSPIRYFPSEESKPFYNVSSILPQKKEPLLLSNVRKEITPQEIRYTRDMSPTGNVVWHNHNEPVQQKPQEQKMIIERQGSWDRLMKRPEEQALQKNQKINEWRKILNEQIKEKMARKKQEEEVRKREEIEAENKYKKQIQELTREIEKRKQRDKSQPKNRPEVMGQYNLHHQSNISPSPRNLPVLKIGSHRNLLSNRENQINYESKDHAMQARRNRNLEKEKDYPSPSKQQREREDSSHKLDFLNRHIENLRNDILQSQKVFRDEMEVLRSETYRPARFRNLAERNLLGAERAGFIRGIANNLPPNSLIYEEDHSNNFDNYVWKLPQKKSKATESLSTQRRDEQLEKFKWDDDATDDFYAGLPSNNKGLIEVQTMVKIQPVTEELLAYKEQVPAVEKKKASEEREIQVEKEKEVPVEEVVFEFTSPVRHKEDKHLEETPVRPRLPSRIRDIRKFSRQNDDLLEDSQPLSALFSNEMSKISKIPDGEDKERDASTDSRNGNVNILIPGSIEEVPQQEDEFQVSNNLQNLKIILREKEGQGDTMVTPSVSSASKRGQMYNDVENIKDKGQTEDIDREDRARKEKEAHVKKTTFTEIQENNNDKKPGYPERRREIPTNNRNKSLKNIGFKSEVALKAMSKFVSKDDPRIVNNNKLQKDPLARLDYMIDYLFNYDSQ